MKKIIGWIKNNPGFLVLCVLILSVTGIFIWVFAYSFYEASANVKASLIGFLGVTGIAIYTNYQTKQREIKARHFTEKRKGYESFVDLFFKAIKATKNKKSRPDKDLQKNMMEFKKSLLIWGGTDVIKSWNDYEKTVTNSHISERELKLPELIQLSEDILRAMRKDLGHDDTSLEFGQLMSLILDEEGKKIFNKKPN